MFLGGITAGNFLALGGRYMGSSETVTLAGMLAVFSMPVAHSLASCSLLRLLGIIPDQLVSSANREENPKVNEVIDSLTDVLGGIAGLFGKIGIACPAGATVLLRGKLCHLSDDFQVDEADFVFFR